MTQMVFVNLPSADLGRSRAFYEGLGYAVDERFSGPASLMVTVSEAIHLMLMPRATLASLVRRPLAPEGTVAGALNLSMESRAAVDAWMARALAHGGTEDGTVDEHGDWMYGRGAYDPDDNAIGVTWMDVEAMMGAQAA